MMISDSDRVENIVEKEKMLVTSTFLIIFSKDFFFTVINPLPHNSTFRHTKDI